MLFLCFENILLKSTKVSAVAHHPCSTVLLKEVNFF